MGTEAALVFSTGYQTNLGIIATLAGRGSVVLQDRLNHASLVDASLLSGGDMVRYPHGDLILRRPRLLPPSHLPRPLRHLPPLLRPSRCHPHRRLITTTETTISMMTMTTAMTMTTKINLMMTGTDV